MSDSSSRVSTVLQGTLAVSAISTFATGIHGILKGKPNYGVLSASAAVNSGISAATFFTIRECIAIPILHGQQSVSSTGSENVRESWTAIRTDKLLASGLSGFAAGGIVRVLAFGPRTALPGATTAGVVCTGLQYICNEARVLRLQYLSEKAKHHERHGTVTSSNEGEPWTTRFLKFMGITPLSDEQYLQKLKLRRDSHLKRIAELEAQLEKEKEVESARNNES